MEKISLDELDGVTGGKMAPALYTQAYNTIQSCGIAVALKDKALEELDRMRSSGTEYSPTDVTEMLRKRGVI